MDDILIDIVSRLPDDQKQGTFSVSASEKITVVGLIRKLCQEQRIQMKSGYVLRDSNEKFLRWSHTLLQCGVRHGNTLFLGLEDEDVHVTTGCGWNTWWFVAAISLLIGGVGITAISVLLTKDGEPIYKYGIVMDAGSSHTTLYVYKWDGSKLHDTALAREIHMCRVQGGGLTEYTENVTALAPPLSVCLEEAKVKIQASKHKTTPVFLGATAGMRMLNITHPIVTKQIFQEVRKTIEKFPFQFESQQARIITGEEEGSFGWITVNYLGGNFGVSRPKLLRSLLSASGETTVGALDMGGASTQISFYTPAKLPNDSRSDLKLYDTNYRIYSHSYLCYGINEAIRRYQAILIKDQGLNTSLITNPCGPAESVVHRSYSEVFEAPCAKQFAADQIDLLPWELPAADMVYNFTGTGNTSQCRETVQKLFNFTGSAPNITFNGTFMPPVHGKFLAFSSFFYEADFLNLTKSNETASLIKYNFSLAQLCNTPWKEVKNMKNFNPSMLPWYCFEGQFIFTLLTDGYKFNNATWENIQFVGKVDNTDVGWSLGFMLFTSDGVPSEGPTSYISTAVFGGLTALFSVFIFLAVAFACYARNYQKRKGMYERVPGYGAI